MNNILSFISLCRKAQKLKMGFDSVKKSLDDSSLVLFTDDISPKTRENAIFAIKSRCVYQDIPFSSEEVHYVVGKKVAILSITDKGLAQALIKRLNESSTTNKPLPTDVAPIKEEFDI